MKISHYTIHCICYSDKDLRKLVASAVSTDFSCLGLTPPDRLGDANSNNDSVEYCCMHEFCVSLDYMYQVSNVLIQLLDQFLLVQILIGQLLHHLFRPEGGVHLLLELVNDFLRLL